MSHEAPRADCGQVAFPRACALEASAEVALEDYARVLTGAAAAAVTLDSEGRITGVHLCGLDTPVPEKAAADIVAFTRELLSSSPGGGLGWS